VGRRRGWFDLDRLLVIFGLLGALSFTNFGTFHGPGFGLIHSAEMYTYYVSSKYFPELGYDGLYIATLQADSESDAPRLAEITRSRDLSTSLPIPASLLRADETVRARFTEERWRAFSQDLEYLLSTGTDAHWRVALRDHGYNGPPTRTLINAATVALTGPATRSSIHAIAFLDVLLLAAMLYGIYKTYGLRVAALVAVLMGSNSLAAYEWIGGTLLRQDWLVASVLGICALRTGRPTLGGVLLGTAAMMRIFPGFFVLAVLIRAVARFARDRRLERETIRFTLGLMLAGVAIGGPTLFLLGGVDAWVAFYSTISVHVAHASVNDMGIPSLVDSAVLLRLVQVAVVAGLAIVSLRVTASQAATLGCVLVFAFGTLSCYYYSLLVLPLLWRRLDEIDAKTVARVAAAFAAPLVAGLAEITSTAPAPTMDGRVFTSASGVLIGAFATLLFLAWREKGSDGQRRPSYQPAG
jgi:hypothetical protein